MEKELNWFTDFDLDNRVLKKVRKNGESSAHIVVPKKYIGKECAVVFMAEKPKKKGRLVKDLDKLQPNGHEKIPISQKGFDARVAEKLVSKKALLDLYRIARKGGME